MEIVKCLWNVIWYSTKEKKRLFFDLLIDVCVCIYRAVHNEITYRSLERFETSDELHILYKNTILDSPEYSQSGSFFPDW